MNHKAQELPYSYFFNGGLFLNTQNELTYLHYEPYNVSERSYKTKEIVNGLSLSNIYDIEYIGRTSDKHAWAVQTDTLYKYIANLNKIFSGDEFFAPHACYFAGIDFSEGTAVLDGFKYNKKLSMLERTHNYKYYSHNFMQSLEDVYTKNSLIGRFNPMQYMSTNRNTYKERLLDYEHHTMYRHANMQDATSFNRIHAIFTYAVCDILL